MSIEVDACSYVCEPDECDTFQFMAKKLGMKVLHPGGLDATEILAKRAGISRDMIILDAGCGSGSSSILQAERYGCGVVGVDLDQSLLMKAHAAARKKGVLDRVAFRLADMHDLPFRDDTFDGAITQATLIFTEKTKTLQMLLRKVRPQGFVGLVELAWKSSPTGQMISRVGEVLCRTASNAELHEGWVNLLRQSGFNVVCAELRDLDFSFRGMLRNEGFLATSKIALKSILDGSVRRKTQEVTSLFKEAREYLGYGIYVARKQSIDRGTAQRQDPRTLGYPDI
jgi:ubiquinone/menaquinone biosynthesis C-methylase UbiE